MVERDTEDPTRGIMVASDTYGLMVIPVMDIEPEEEGLYHYTTIKAIEKTKEPRGWDVKFTANNEYAWTLNAVKYPRALAGEDTSLLQFPDWRSFIPLYPRLSNLGLGKIGMNMPELVKFTKALGIYDDPLPIVYVNETWVYGGFDMQTRVLKPPYFILKGADTTRELWPNEPALDRALENADLPQENNDD